MAMMGIFAGWGKLKKISGFDPKESPVTLQSPPLAKIHFHSALPISRPVCSRETRSGVKGSQGTR